MQTKTIIRIESEKDGWGMFMRTKNLKARECMQSIGLFDALDRHKEFRSPKYEGLDTKKDDKEWFCAYKNLEQLRKWLEPREVKYLAKGGFKVLMLEVEEFQEGELQVIYTKESVVSTKDLTKIFI